ncbi:MAG: DUF6544 family protein [Desulfotignum sp.]
MMLTTFLLIIVFVGLALSAWRFLDHLADRAVMHRLMSMQPVQPAYFDPAMTSDLPEPARRYFLYTIKPGTPLYRVAKISMSGRFGMAPDGQPIRVCFDRWSDANPEKQHRLQPFGGYLSEFQSFDGFRLPTHVEAGNHFGMDQYFPFFVADVTEVIFK